MMEAEIEEPLWLPEAGEGGCGRGKEGPFSGAFGGSVPDDTLISVLQPPDCERTHFYCLEPPGLWHFVMATPENE